MARRKAGVEDRILVCAKDEFLSQGYRDASLRTIASKAETSTNAIYVRFGDKDGLYAAIVEPCIKGFIRQYIDSQERFHAYDAETQIKDVESYTDESVHGLIDYVYDHYDEFRLLMDPSYGKRFENFIHELADLQTEYTFAYLQSIGWTVKEDSLMDVTFLHLLMSGYFDAWFEPVRHGMDRAYAQQYIRLLQQYHNAGVLATYLSETRRPE